MGFLIGHPFWGQVATAKPAMEVPQEAGINDDADWV